MNNERRVAPRYDVWTGLEGAATGVITTSGLQGFRFEILRIMSGTIPVSVTVTAYLVYL